MHRTRGTAIQNLSSTREDQKRLGRSRCKWKNNSELKFQEDGGTLWCGFMFQARIRGLFL
jgi:hypothetical protein